MKSLWYLLKHAAASSQGIRVERAHVKKCVGMGVIKGRKEEYTVGRMKERAQKQERRFL